MTELSLNKTDALADLKASVRRYVAEAADMEEDEFSFDDNIVEDLGIDSLGIVGIFIDLAYDFNIKEPQREEDWAAYNTPRQIFEFVRLLLAQS